MIDLKKLKVEYEKLLEELQDPELISDYQRFQELSKKRAHMEKILKIEKELEETNHKLEENKQILSSQEEPELTSLAEEELKTLKEQKKSLEQELEKQLNKKQDMPQAIIMEIRAGTGGEEAALFASDLLNMYARYAVTKGWKEALLDENKTDIGGIKEATLEIDGEDAFLNLQYEGGVHRVQRIPETEKAGRIHTSTATVAVFPKAEKTQFQINPGDLRIEFTGSSGPGGQNVNKRQTAVRLTHIPTGTVVFTQTSRSQQKNKEAALSLLESKLLQSKQEKDEKEVAGQRKIQIGWAKRVEKIRTYNFPQDRITDHRIEKSWHGLEKVMAGELDPIIEALQNYQKENN